MSRPEQPVTSPLPQQNESPAFAEPWQAQCLAIVDALIGNGTIAPSAWSAALGEELRRFSEWGAPDTQETYYAAVLAALEDLLAKNGTVTRDVRDARYDAWRRAHHDTPHGQPVRLDGASSIAAQGSSATTAD